ncbi:hypothetical protein Efla_007214 [Eimeria flavescens]
MEGCAEFWFAPNQTASSIALLKLAHEGALTLTRSLGSLVMQRICVAVTVFAASSFFDHKRSNRPYASQARMLLNRIALSLAGAREASERNSLRAAAIALSQVLNYLVGLQQCKTLLVLKTNFSSFGCSLRAANEIGLSASVGRVRRS